MDQDANRVDTKEWREYVAAVRSAAPTGYELAMNQAGLSAASQAYVFSCYLNDVLPAECAKKLTDKLKVVG